MAAVTNTQPRQLWFQRGLRLWDALTKPPVQIDKPEDQRRVRMLTTIMLVVFLSAIITWMIAPDRSPVFLAPVLMELVLTTVIYTLLRTRYYRFGVYVYIAVAVLHHLPLVYVSSLANLLFAVMSYMLVSVFLNVRQAIVYGLLSFGAILIAYLSVAGMPHVRELPARGVLIYAWVMMIAVMLTSFVRWGDLHQIETQSEKLRESNTRLRGLIDAIPDNIYFKDREGRFVLVNRATWMNDGFSGPEAMIGKNDCEVYGAEAGAELSRSEKQLLQTGEAIINQEFCIPGRSLADNRAWVLISKVPLYDDHNNILGLIGINRDITERKRAEEELRTAKNAAEAAIRARDAFLANMTHELRTPLNVILGMSQWMVQDGDLSTTIRESIQAIHRSGEHLLSLINELLSLSRSAGAAGSADPSAVEDATEDMIDDAENASPTRPIQIARQLVQVEPALQRPSVLVVEDHADSRLMLVSMLEAVGLKVYQAADGYEGIDAAVKWRPGVVLLDVRMPGIDGFETAQQIRAKMGDQTPPLVALTADLTDEQADIAIVAGFDDIVAKPFQFTTLTDKLTQYLGVPVGAEAAEPPLILDEYGDRTETPTEENEIIQPGMDEPAQILVVDDKPENITLLANILRKQGYIVRSAPNGMTALQSVQFAPPDLILLDVRMPDMNGYQVCERLKSDPRLRFIPIIFISVADDTLDKVRAFELGAVDYITKPFEVTELKMRIATHLAFYRLAAAEERQRIARDLHDAVSQTLFSASMMAETLPRLFENSPDDVRSGLDELAKLTKGALAEMRALLIELRPTALAQTDLELLLSYLVTGTQARGAAEAILVTNGTETFLPSNVKINLYRIAQEALNNIVKHAQATHIEVTLNYRPDSVILQIRDDGCGFEPEDTSAGQHMGLRIMSERASSVGITLDIASAINQGTLISAVWRDSVDNDEFGE